MYYSKGYLSILVFAGNISFPQQTVHVRMPIYILIVLF